MLDRRTFCGALASIPLLSGLPAFAGERLIKRCYIDYGSLNEYPVVDMFGRQVASGIEFPTMTTVQATFSDEPSFQYTFRGFNIFNKKAHLKQIERSGDYKPGIWVEDRHIWATMHKFHEFKGRYGTLTDEVTLEKFYINKYNFLRLEIVTIGDDFDELV